MRRTGHSGSPNVDAEATLVVPRFDEAEARRAHRVVPLRTLARRESPRRSATWGDLLPRRARGLTAGAWRPALLAVPLLLAVVAAGLTAATDRSAPRETRANEVAPPIAGAAEPEAQESPGEQFMVVPVVRPKEARAASESPRRQGRERRAGGGAELVGSFVIPSEEFAEEGRMEDDDRGRGKKRRGRRDEGLEELDKFAERLGRGREARRVKDFLDEMEQ